MAQYCRYCAFAFEGDCFYCGKLDKVLSEHSIKSKNNCQSFVLSDLGDVETGRQYQPRKSKPQDFNNYEQIKLEV